MQLLEDHIRREGKIAPGNVLRVDGFLNHQIDVVLLTKLAEEFRRRYEGVQVDKVLTIEASGIAIGCLVAQQFGVPLLFAKKSRSSNLPADVYATAVHSYTHGNVNQVVVSKEFLHSGEHVLLIDDFLAHGEALAGLVSLVQQAGGRRRHRHRKSIPGWRRPHPPSGHPGRKPGPYRFHERGRGRHLYRLIGAGLLVNHLKLCSTASGRNK